MSSRLSLNDITPILGMFTPSLPLLITTSEYERLIQSGKYTLEVAVRQVSIGLFAYLKGMSKEELKMITSIPTQAWSQILLKSQQLESIRETKGKKIGLQTLKNGLKCVFLRRRFEEERMKIIPIVEETNLIKIVFLYMHENQYGGIKIGRRIHL